jgi:hypothetical protein
MDGTMALVIGQVVLSVVPPVPMIALVLVLNIVPLQTFGVPRPGKPDAGQASGRKIAGAVYGSRSHWAGGFPQPLRRRFGRTVLGRSPDQPPDHGAWNARAGRFWRSGLPNNAENV